MDRLTDTEIVARVREIIADALKLADHYEETGAGSQLAESSAFNKIRRLLEAQAEAQSRT